jgi:hypothetical protein
MGLDSLRSYFFTSMRGGCFFAHSKHVVTPGSASSLAAAIAFPHTLHNVFDAFPADDLLMVHRSS